MANSSERQEFDRIRELVSRWVLGDASQVEIEEACARIIDERCGDPALVGVVAAVSNSDQLFGKLLALRGVPIPSQQTAAADLALGELDLIASARSFRELPDDALDGYLGLVLDESTLAKLRGLRLQILDFHENDRIAYYGVESAVQVVERSFSELQQLARELAVTVASARENRGQPNPE